MFCCQDALVAELVDAHASGACGRSPVEVQVLFRAPIYKIKALQFLRGFFLSTFAVLYFRKFRILNIF